MTRRTLAPALVLACVLHAASSSAATPIFLMDNRPGVSNAIFRVAPATGQLTQIGAIPLSFGDALGLAAESHDVLYVTTVDAPAAARLLRVTVDPFTIVEAGALRGFYQGLVWSDGRLYGIDESTEQLWRIEPTLPATETLVGTLRLGSPAGPVFDSEGGDLAVSAAGTWYLWNNANAATDVYVLDPATAVVTQTDPATFQQLSGIAFDFQAGDTLLASSGGNNTLETIDRATGATTASVALCLACPTVYDHVFGDLASPRCTDVDGDGFAAEGGPCGTIDCDDTNPTRFPGAAERCNGADDDCDGSTDEEPAASAACATACTATAVCQAGACVTTPVVCADGNPCTADACDPVAGCQFVDQPDGLSCSDGNVCTGEEVCIGGACSNVPDLDCGDGNACTSDSCAPPNGCRNLPIAGCCTSDADCADASQCTENERCVSGECLSDPVSCADGNVCTSDSCNPASGCANIAVLNGISCADGNVCNGLETCQSGSCTAGTPLGCGDGNACTVDGCNPQTGCSQQPTPGCCASDADCADASACTINERCANQACVSDPLPCSDGNLCTSDGCNPASGCTFTPGPNGQSCSDLDFCNGLETCQAGACVGSTPPSCSDANPCTSDTCSGSTGCVHTPVASCCFVDGDCVDADACTVNERCVGGQCLSDPRNCVDGSPCTSDLCLPASGCANPPLVDGTSCGDDNTCDGAETCTAGACQSGAPPDCDDRNFCTRDSCANATGCRHDPVAGCCNDDADCADADLCTVNERCTATHACASDARTCTDGGVCTVDACEPSAGCVFTPASGPSCDDGNPCTAGDACSGGACLGAPVVCQDANLCDGREQCDALSGTCRDGTGPLVCTPGSSRSDRTCSAEWYVENANNPTGPLSKVQDCRQDDPSCDGDASPDTCTFGVAFCFHVPDPRFSPTCVPSGISEYRLRRPNPQRDATNAFALLGALEALPGATRTGRQGRSVIFEQPLEQLTCTAVVPVVVPVAGRATIAGKTLSVDGAPDSDVLKLRCFP